MRIWSLFVLSLAALCVGSRVDAQSATVKAAPTAEVGSKLEVHWTGPAGKGDFVSIDAAGAPDHTYGPYAYPSTGNPVSILVPTNPGQYQVRYHTGAGGKDIVLRLPRGTQVFAEDNETLLVDLTEIGQTVVLCKGGDGGYGNLHFKSSTNRAPRRADKGWPGEERWIWLRLKLIADIGLVGLPNAGKSTFLAAVTNARPKIADYPFTTLHPGLGVVKAGDPPAHCC